MTMTAPLHPDTPTSVDLEMPVSVSNGSRVFHAMSVENWRPAALCRTSGTYCIQRLGKVLENGVKPCHLCWPEASYRVVIDRWWT